MSELLSESYQSGIYWAVINAEQARERAANAELDYWTKRAEKDGLVVRVERADGPCSAVDDGVCAGREKVQETPQQSGKELK
jgi:hypothetical protein